MQQGRRVRVRPDIVMALAAHRPGAAIPPRCHARSADARMRA